MLASVHEPRLTLVIRYVSWVGILAHAWEQKQQGRRIMGPMPKEIPFRYSGPATRHLNTTEGNKS